MHRTLDARHDRFVLNHPFRISRGVKTVADVITVTVREDDATGRGEGVPYQRYGENVASALAAVEEVREAVEAGADRHRLLSILPAGAARNAIDSALWELEAHRSKRDVASIIGVPPPGRMISALTVVIDSPHAMESAARRLADAPLLKVKVDSNDPAAQIRAVRRGAPKATLIVDPNESWDKALVEAMQPVLVGAAVALLEQPVPAEADEWLEGWVPAVPICADEAIHVASDLRTVARRYQVINVKLDKAGGLTTALELIRAARASGLGVMTGCMVSSSLSVAPALHIAQLSNFVDLDGPLWLREDRPGGVRNEDGILIPPEAGFWGTACG